MAIGRVLDLMKIFLINILLFFNIRSNEQKIVDKLRGLDPSGTNSTGMK